jgi:hypothetical protein
MEVRPYGWTGPDLQGVFDFIAMGGQARRPGRGHPWPGSRGICSLFDLYVRDESG